MTSVRLLLIVLALTCSGCIVAVRSDRVGQRELMVTSTQDLAYSRAQRAVMHMGLQITESHDAAMIFVARRPTGATIQISTKPLALGTLVTIEGVPPHDITDVVAAYQREQ